MQILHFGIQALPQCCVNVSLLFHLPTCPHILYTAIQLHYSWIANILYFPVSAPMLMQLFLPRIPSPSILTTHLRCPFFHYAFVVPLRHVSLTGLSSGTLLAVKDHDHCIAITLRSLLLACVLFESQDLLISAHFPVSFLFQLHSKWLLVPFINT